MILIALGANLPSRYGEPEETFRAAEAELARRGVKILHKSSIYVTDPVPVSDQPKYRNAMISVATDLSARDIFTVLKNIEKDFGRVSTERNAARVLDLDLIAYHDLVLNEGDLIVPHPRMHERLFVLEPLADLTKSWVHPVLKMDLANLIHSLTEKVSRETALQKGATHG